MAKTRRQLRCRARAPARPFVPRFVSRPRVEIDRGLAWYVIWTRARAERQAEDDLRRAEFSTYLPTQRLEVVQRGRVVEVERPPVSRYLFVGLCARQPEFGRLDAILAGPNAGWFFDPPTGSLLRVSGEPVRVGAGALQAFADECTGNGLSAVSGGRSPLRRYQTARITDGPLCGLSMRIEDVLCDDRVRGLVDMLGGRVMVEATADQLEAA
jgi:hypothetical protein